MALTPEEVLNKTFTQTQFRRGYDEREVDDFLDDVVAEMRRLTKETEETRGQLNECREGRGLPADAAPVAQAPAANDLEGELTDAKTRNAELERIAAEYKERITQLESQHADHGTLQGKLTELSTAHEALQDEHSRLQDEHSDLTSRLSVVEGKHAGLLASIDESDRGAAEAAQADGVARREAQESLEAIQAKVQQAEAEAQDRIAKANQQAEQAEREAADRVSAAQAQQASAADTDNSDHHADTGTDGSGGSSLAAAGAGGLGAAGVLALAQRLHDEHVAAGHSTRERLIAEGQGRHDELLDTAQARHDELVTTGQSTFDQLTSSGQAKHDDLVNTATAQRGEMLSAASAQRDEMLTEARERSTGMVAEAQQKKAAILSELSEQQEVLEHKIDQLKAFERDYRLRLKDFINDQLGRLEQTAVDLQSPGDEADEADGADGAEASTVPQEQPAKA